MTDCAGVSEAEHVGADGALFDRATKSLATAEVDVGFEQRDANFAQYLATSDSERRPRFDSRVEDRAEALARASSMRRYGASWRVSSIFLTASPTVLIFSASSSGMSMLNSVSNAITSST
jgi:hypothetical protein